MVFLAKSRSSEIPLFIAYILVLHISEIVFDFVVSPYVQHHIGNLYLKALAEPLWKVAFWIAPTILYIVYVEHRNPITYLKLNTNVRKGLLWGLAVTLVFTSGVCYRHFFLHAPINLNLGFDAWLNIVVLVGFFEEVPFRGLVFQKLNEFMSFWQASCIGSLLFVCLHIPYWISLGKPSSYFLPTGLYIFVFAFIMCIVLKRSGSLWGSIIIHTVNDLVSLIM